MSPSVAPDAYYIVLQPADVPTPTPQELFFPPKDF